jgi:hypothetical protein
MKPDPLEDPRSAVEDRRDNRRAFLVALAAALVIAIACLVLLATAQDGPLGSSPSPNPAPSTSWPLHGHFRLE